MTELVDGSRSRAEVRAMVRTALPDWTVRAVDHVGESVNGVYPVTVADGLREVELVLKVRGSTDAASFRPEPYLLDAVDRRTDVPVPSVVAVVDDGDDAPYFLMERCGGERLDGRADELAPAVRDRLARDAGRHLGQFHLLGSFERFGHLRMRESAVEGTDGAERPRRTLGERRVTRRGDARPDECGIEEPEFTVAVADDGCDDWADRFRALTARHLDGFGDGFDDLRDGVGAALEEVDVPDADPVFAHDYRYWNLLADPDTGATTAVLDFENATTTAARFDLVETVDRLSAWARPGTDRRRRVRECVLVGYETATGRRPDLDAPVCDAYRLASRLPALARFDRRHADDAPGARDAAAQRHRDAVDALLERRRCG